MNISSDLYRAKIKETVGQVHCLSDQMNDCIRRNRISRFKNAGFIYDASNDSGNCPQCDFTVERCSQQSNLEAQHRESKPDCPISQQRQMQTNGSAKKNYTEHFFKRQRLDTRETEANDEILFKEINTVKRIRAATFTSWKSPSFSKELLEVAGFFYSDVGDRVICLYCNLICQDWSVDHDDPIETHRILSPNCVYASFCLAVKENLSSREFNADVEERCDRLSDSEHVSYTYYSDRNASFNTGSCSLANQSHALARAGFAYVSASQHLQCFYCDLTVDTIDSNTDPLERHLELSPNCSYAKKRYQSKLIHLNKTLSRGSFSLVYFVVFSSQTCI